MLQGVKNSEEERIANFWKRAYCYNLVTSSLKLSAALQEILAKKHHFKFSKYQVGKIDYLKRLLPPGNTR